MKEELLGRYYKIKKELVERLDKDKVERGIKKDFTVNKALEEYFERLDKGEKE